MTLPWDHPAPFRLIQRLQSGNTCSADVNKHVIAQKCTAENVYSGSCPAGRTERARLYESRTCRSVSPSSSSHVPGLTHCTASAFDGQGGRLHAKAPASCAYYYPTDAAQVMKLQQFCWFCNQQMKTTALAALKKKAKTCTASLVSPAVLECR